jgi:L-ascorbate metabolism protein UlaG (beta-lactamase superfamily)
MHGDHLGNAHTQAVGAGTCASPDMSVSATPERRGREHRAGQEVQDRDRQRDAAVLRRQAAANGGNPADSMLARFGGSVTVGGVRIATVTAMHSNGLDPDYIGGDLGKAMKDAGIWGDVGLATGYVLRFSNGLVAYLSGDTGITADQERWCATSTRRKLAVMNIGDGFTTGPAEAAYVINDLVKPASVIASHANEAGTSAARCARAARPRPSSRRARCRCTSRCPAAR